MWCWRRLLLVLWTARKSNESILKEISPEYSLEGLMLKLKLQYIGHLMGRADSSEKTQCSERLKAGGKGGDRGWDVWMASPTQWTWVWASSRRQWRTGSLACCSPWVTESDVTEALNKKGQWMALCCMGDKCAITGDTQDFLNILKDGGCEGITSSTLHTPVREGMCTGIFRVCPHHHGSWVVAPEPEVACSPS